MPVAFLLCYVSLENPGEEGTCFRITVPIDQDDLRGRMELCVGSKEPVATGFDWEPTTTDHEAVTMDG